jgi:hypothetical protein
MINSLVLFLLIICMPTAYTKCFSDIYSVGLSADSGVYDITQNAPGKAQVSTEGGLGIYLGKIFLCPSQRYELYPYFRLRQFSLSRPSSEFDQLPERITLPSLGAKARYFWQQNWEIVLDLELRDEYRFYNDTFNGTILGEAYLNLKFVAGARYFFHSTKTEDYTAAIKLGPLFGISSSIGGGQSIEFDFEYFRRLSQKHSVRADLYYSTYSQDMDQVTMGRNELGARFNYIFRY